MIRECATRLLAGEAIRSICRDLTERGVATVTGAEWKPQTLRRILMSARISGQREHHGELVALAEWPAIITPAETRADPGAAVRPGPAYEQTARRYLLVRLAALRPLRRGAGVAPPLGRRAPLCLREWPGLLRLRPYLRHGRPARTVHRRSRALPARLARACRRPRRLQRERPRRGALAGRGRAVPQPSWTSWPRCTAAARSASRSGKPPARRSSGESPTRKKQLAPAKPHLRARRPRRQRRRAARPLGRASPEPPTRDRRRRPRPRDRRPRTPRLQQL